MWDWGPPKIPKPFFWDFSRVFQVGWGHRITTLELNIDHNPFSWKHVPWFLQKLPVKGNAGKNTETAEIQTEILIVFVQEVTLKILTFSRSYCAADPRPPIFTCNKRSENRSVTYSFCCIHTHGCVHNQVYSHAPLWFPSRAALELCFITSCTVIPTHSRSE